MAITDKHIESHILNSKDIIEYITKALFYTNGIHTNIQHSKEVEVAIDRDMSNGTKVIVIINLPQWTTNTIKH